MLRARGLIDWTTHQNGAVLAAEMLECAIQQAKSGHLADYTREVQFFDFASCGKEFTQVALILRPSRPLSFEGRNVVLITSEGGSDNGRAFIHDNAGRDGLGPWLAKRGVMFIQLCRLGRWNFLSDDPLGSWGDVPLGGRMPVFNRTQGHHWSASEYETVNAREISSPTGSQACRIPREGSDLEAYMLAQIPTTILTGFETAIAALISQEERTRSLILYYGFSTGGAYLWPLAKRLQPDGIVGYGMSNFPIAYYMARAERGKYEWLYDRSVTRVRERGATDFEYFNRDLNEADRNAHWENAKAAPRFKSFEDTFMFFNIAALAETVTRLWNSSFLPNDIRRRGISTLMQENLHLCFPDDGLQTVRVLDLYGTRDEVLTPDVARSVEQIVGPYCRTYRMAFLHGYHHSIAIDHSEAFGSLWLDAIRSGYFARDASPSRGTGNA